MKELPEAHRSAGQRWGKVLKNRRERERHQEGGGVRGGRGDSDFAKGRRRPDEEERRSATWPRPKTQRVLEKVFCSVRGPKREISIEQRAVQGGEKRREDFIARGGVWSGIFYSQ